MSNPYVDNLIKQLGEVMQQNRDKRNAADSMLLAGIQQGKERAALEAKNKAELSAPEQSGYQKPGSVDPAYRYERTSPQSAHFRPPTEKPVGYPTPGVKVEPAYRYNPSSPEAAGGTPEARMALAQKMIQAQQMKEEDQNVAGDPEGNDVLGLGILSPNYQKNQNDASGLGTISKNYRAGQGSKAAEGFFRGKDATPEPMDPAITAAMRTDPKQAAAIDAAGHPDTGNFGSIAGNTNLGGPSSSYGGDKASYSLAGSSPTVKDLRNSVRGEPSPEDMALLNELAKRYHSPEELSGR